MLFLKKLWQSILHFFFRNEENNERSPYVNEGLSHIPKSEMGERIADILKKGGGGDDG